MREEGLREDGWIEWRRVIKEKGLSGRECTT